MLSANRNYEAEILKETAWSKAAADSAATLVLVIQGGAVVHEACVQLRSDFKTQPLNSTGNPLQQHDHPVEVHLTRQHDQYEGA
jgi:hypothetical protein